MYFKQIKSSIFCGLGAVGVMSVIYILLFKITKLNFNINCSYSEFLDYVEQLSWRYVNFLFGSFILFIECLSVKNKKQRMICNIFLIFSVSLLVLFSIFCFQSNSQLFSFNMIVVGIILFILSLITTDVLKNSIDNNKKYNILYIGLTNLVIIFLMLSTILGFESKKEMKGEIARVAQKYSKEFTDLGYIEVESVFEDNKNGFGQPNSYSIFTFKRSTIQQDYELIPGDYHVSELLKNKLSIYAFNNIDLFVKNNKLYIKNIKYDPKLITQKELANELDILMNNFIMPKLRKTKENLNHENAVAATYK